MQPEKKAEIFTADISGLEPGIYLVRIHGSHADISRKLIVEP
jgi:hypothetical protein